MKIRQKIESNWFNEVIEKFLNGQEVSSHTLTEKQALAFSRFMVSDRYDITSSKKVYDSKDGRYSAIMNCGKYNVTLKVHDNLKRKYNQLTLSISNLKMDIEEDGENEFNLADLAGYESELSQIQF